MVATISDNINQYSVVWVEMPKRIGDPHVQMGMHPCVVISNDDCNTHSPVITILPITSKDKRPWMPTHYRMKMGEARKAGLYKESTIMAEAIMPIGKNNIIKKVGEIAETSIPDINRILLAQFGMVI